MRTCRILAFLAAISVASAGFAQPVTFDFEGVTIADLETAGWEFVDDIDIQTDPGPPPVVVQYPGTIQIETTIVHDGTQALRMSLRDLAYFPLNGEFGTLDLWAYDHGYRLHEFLAGGSSYGARFGLQKYSADGYGFGIGAGLGDRPQVDNDEAYPIEWGLTGNTLKYAIENIDPNTVPWPYDGWCGNQSWFSVYYSGWLPNGRPPDTTGGWNHWRIAYLAPGQAEIELLESWAGDSRVPSIPGGAPGNSFDGTVPGGVSDIFLGGGATWVNSSSPDVEFGDGIFDDITWTPAEAPQCGDADGDGDTDLDDFAILKNTFGDVPLVDDRADFDGNGAVDLDDFAILKNCFGTAVPEPATMSLLVLGGLAVLRRRRS